MPFIVKNVVHVMVYRIFACTKCDLEYDYASSARKYMKDKGLNSNYLFLTRINQSLIEGVNTEEVSKGKRYQA
jgi:hypothetical protein